MRKASFPALISVILLVAIIFAAAISLAYWAGGQILGYSTADTPLPILGVVFKSHPGYLQVAIANLGERPLPEGISFIVAENQAETLIPNKIDPGEQQVVWFWGRYDKQDGYLGFEEQATIFDPVTGATAPTIMIPQTEAMNITAYEAVGTEGFEPSMNTIEDNSGVLWMIFTSNETIGSHDIWIMNSADGINWNAAFTIAVQGVLVQEDSPQITYNGTYYALYRSWYEDRNIRFMKSSNGYSWTTPVQTNVDFIDPDGNDYRYDDVNKRGFGFMIDHNDLFWMTYIDGTDVIVRNSTDGISWNNEIVVNNSASPGKVSMMQDDSNEYWVAYVGADDTTIGVSHSSDANSWNQPVIVSDEDFESACTGPSIIQDQIGNYFLFADQDNECQDIYVKASTDGQTWSRASWLPNITTSDRHPSSIQTSAGIYVLAFADLSSVKIRASNDPMIWVNV